MLKVAAVVILYYPEMTAIDNILSYSSNVDVIYALDNSEKPNEEFVTKIKTIPNCLYRSYLQNDGIAKRLNEACALAQDQGYEWLLTMDQDSSFLPENFKQYLNYCEGSPNQNVAVFGVNFMPEFWKVEHRSIEAISTITSGSLVNLRLNSVIGRFNENLFIDLVDAEYCYRAYGCGYKIVIFRDIVLNHRIGYIKMGRSLKNFKLTPRILHSPQRLYYLIRNSLYMLYTVNNLPVGAAKEIKKTLFLLKNNLIYHPERIAVIKNIFRGYWDFKHNRMGKKSKNN